MAPHPKEVFLSYSSLDWRIADEITRLLQRHDVPLWDSRSSILPGHDWYDEIGRALRRCDWFVILLSPNSINSAWVNRELVFAMSQERLKSRIVPIVISAYNDDELSWSLVSYQLVDFTEDFEKGCRALLRIWGIGYQATGPDA
jgi:hypothetical protein